MALWMYGFLVVSAELSGQNATVHGRNLEELVDCGVCKAVPLSTCKYCHEGSSSSSPSQPRRRRARRRRTVPQLELGSHEPRRRQPRRRSPGGSSASPSQPRRRRTGTAPGNVSRVPDCPASYRDCGTCKCVPPSSCTWCPGGSTTTNVTKAPINLDIPPGTSNSVDLITEKLVAPPNSSMDPLLIVTVVLLVSCGAFGAGCLWKRHKEKQNVEGANPDPELQPAAGHGQVALPRQPQSPTKPSLLALIPTLSVRKVLPPSVQCSGQISAQWPRRKVAFFTVESGSFKAFGHRYSIEDPDKPQLTKKFYWAVGTLQTLCRIDRNTIEWQTNHSNPEWQRFLWVCTPECTHGSTSHATEFSASSYKCSICKSSGNEKHWQCVEHNVHFCCNCAVPPLKPPTLGVSARYAVDVFPPLARSTTGAQNPDFYAMCPRLALGEHGLGFRKICPRDGRPNCSLVDALEDQYSGKVTHFVSWCWGYTLQDFVSAVSAWLRRSELTPDDVFLWFCFFCNNQYRIMDEGTKTGSDELKAVFETHLAEAGQMCALSKSFP